MYKGEWKNDEQNGRGEELWTDGAHFEGIYQKGKKKFGLLRWPNGTSFEGEFSNNKMTGKGMFRWPDNRFYYG